MGAGGSFIEGGDASRDVKRTLEFEVLHRSLQSGQDETKHHEPVESKGISETSSAFPMCGLKLSMIAKFMETCGGKDAFVGLTTEQMFTKFVRPRTQFSDTSLCGLLKAFNHEAVDSANLVVFHVWQYPFLDLLDALQYHLRDSPDVFVWLDVFSMNLNHPLQYDVDAWSAALKYALKSIGHAILVLSPWDSHVPFSRLWCLLELYYTAICAPSSEKDEKSQPNVCRFEVAMNEKDHFSFIHEIEDKGPASVDNWIGFISSENAVCNLEIDQQAILQHMRKTVGYHALDTIVVDLLRDWVIREAERVINMHTESEVRHLKLQTTLGKLFSNQGNFSKAEPLFLSCMETRKRTLGEDHPDTLSTAFGLASLYQNRGKYTKAEPLYLSCWELGKKALGEAHPNILKSMYVLAINYVDMHALDKARPLLESCLQLRTDVLGPLHADTLRTMHSLATLHSDQGHTQTAEDMLLDCCMKRKELFGENHDETIKTMDSLATIYIDQEKFELAEPLFKSSLSANKALHGDFHLNTLHSLNNLASLYGCEDRFEDAEPLFLSCLEINRMKFGPQHSDTIFCLKNLAALYDNQGQADKAEKFYLQLLDVCKEKYGEAHSESLKSMNYLASLYGTQGHYDKAAPYFEKCFEMNKKRLGQDHPNTLRSMNNLARLYGSQQKYEEAEELLKKCYELRKAKLGAEHPETLKTQKSMASLKDKKSTPRARNMIKDTSTALRTVDLLSPLCTVQVPTVLTENVAFPLPSSEETGTSTPPKVPEG